jgi:hypothetical protein
MKEKESLNRYDFFDDVRALRLLLFDRMPQLSHRGKKMSPKKGKKRRRYHKKEVDKWI